MATGFFSHPYVLFKPAPDSGSKPSTPEQVQWSLDHKRPIHDQLLLLGYDFEVYSEAQDGYYYAIYPTNKKEWEGYKISIGTERCQFKLLADVQTWIDEVAEIRREAAAEKGKITLYDFMHGVRKDW